MNVGVLWLINENNEVLIARRAGNLDSDPGVWGPSVSGGVESGETYRESILRETSEELSINTDALELTHLHDETYRHKDGKVRKFGFFYARAGVDTISQARLEPTEVAEVRWISLRDLRNFFQSHPESVLISEATQVWQNIFINLESVVSQA